MNCHKEYYVILYNIFVTNMINFCNVWVGYSNYEENYEKGERME